jgi:transcription elongation factor Elf1
METNVNITLNTNIDLDSTITSEEYVTTLVELLQPILENRFPQNKGKQKIRVYKDRINFACPVCGDSMKSDYKKRGNFILKGKYIHFFKCHNCGIALKIDNFFKNYNISLNLSVINYISSQIQDFSTQSNAKYDMSLFLDMESIDKYAIDRQELLRYFGLIEVKDSPVWPWLKNRLQYDQSKFMYNANKNYLVILNLTPSGKIIGLQKRMFKGDNKYMTYKLAKLYELMNKDPKIVPDELDMISQLFNICLISYNKPIVLLEGPLDSFLIKNSIANSGANKSFPLDLRLMYLYDKDETGIKKSIEHINDDDEVFLWDKFLRDVGAPYRKKWDISDIFIWAKENNLKLPNILNYFSKDPLDIVDI